MAYLSVGREAAGSRGAGAGAGRTALVLAADHLITPPELFRDAVAAADELAREGYLVTFGVTPTRAETGYGYIEAGEEHGPGRLVHAFREKPDRETAEEYYASGRHFWNSGMFVFEGASFWAELETHAPEVAAAFSGLGAGGSGGSWAFSAREENGICTAGDPAALAEAYGQAPKTSIDYALMEQSSRVAMVPAGFTWNDVGSWDEIAALSERGVLDPKAALTLLEEDADNQKSPAPAVEVEASGNFVFSDLPVALAGVKGLIVVVKNGRVLITRRGDSQLVKGVVERLETGRQDHIL
jgi:mannose-1-phosphate guanylyltransferase